MNFRKKLQSLLLTGTLLSSVCVYAMDDDTAMDVDSSGHVSAAPAPSTVAWKEVAKNICQFLDPQSLRRFQQASKICRAGGDLYLDQILLKENALIEHLKTLPTTKEALAYLSTYAKHDLHAGDHFLDAFYKYLELPQKERLFLVQDDDITLNSFGSVEDFTRKVLAYRPYGLCLISSYYLSFSPCHLYRVLDKRFSKSGPMPWSPEAQAYAYLFFDLAPRLTQGGEMPFSFGESDLDIFWKYVLNPVSTLTASFGHSEAQEKRKAFYLRNPFQLKYFHKERKDFRKRICDPGPEKLKDPRVQNFLASVKSQYKPLLEDADLDMEALEQNRSRLEAIENRLWDVYAKGLKGGKNAPPEAFQWAVLKSLTSLYEESERFYYHLYQDYTQKAGATENLQEKDKFCKHAAFYLGKYIATSGKELLANAHYTYCREYLSLADAFTDPAEKERGFKLAFSNYEKFLQIKGDAATAEDHIDCGVYYCKTASFCTTPAERAAHFKTAASHQEKALEKLGATAPALLYSYCAESYFYAAKNLTDPQEKAAALARAAALNATMMEKDFSNIQLLNLGDVATSGEGPLANTYYRYFQEYLSLADAFTGHAEKERCFQLAFLNYEKFLQIKGEAATAEDHINCGVQYFNTASSFTTPAERAAHFKKAAFHQEKGLEKMGDAAPAQLYSYCVQSYWYAANSLTDPAERAAVVARAAALSSTMMNKFF